MSLDDKRHRSAKAYSGLNATARDLAKIGRLYLNGGRHQGKQIVSEEWVKASITPNLDNDAYQYQWYSFDRNLVDTEGKTRYFDTASDGQAVADTLSVEYAQVMPSQKYPSRFYVSTASDRFYAHGILNQHLYVDPTNRLIAVRLGKKYDNGFLGIFQAISEKKALARPASR